MRSAPAVPPLPSLPQWQSMRCQCGSANGRSGAGRGGAAARDGSHGTHPALRLHENAVLLLRPAALLDRGVELVEPPLSALLPCSAPANAGTPFPTAAPQCAPTRHNRTRGIAGLSEISPSHPLRAPPTPSHGCSWRPSGARCGGDAPMRPGMRSAISDHLVIPALMHAMIVSSSSFVHRPLTSPGRSACVQHRCARRPDGE